MATAGTSGTMMARGLGAMRAAPEGEQTELHATRAHARTHMHMPHPRTPHQGFVAMHHGPGNRTVWPGIYRRAGDSRGCPVPGWW